MADSAGAAAEAVAVQPEYTDTDGTVMEWDAERKAYFPKVLYTRFCSPLFFPLFFPRLHYT